MAALVSPFLFFVIVQLISDIFAKFAIVPAEVVVLEENVQLTKDGELLSVPTLDTTPSVPTFPLNTQLVNFGDVGVVFSLMMAIAPPKEDSLFTNSQF